jgi:fructose-1,6-bisphosphatase/inositol monophosphatase family enzyme
MTPEFKADDSYVTNVDRETEKFVAARLAERYPDFAFLGEEFGRHGDADAPLWAVDPIDGTTNMVFGIPVWCVSIGLIHEGEAIAGALSLPRTNELFWGVKGKGAFCNGIRLQTQDRTEIHVEDTLGFTSGAIKRLETNTLSGRLRCLGSIAADIAYTARGTLCSLVGWNEGAYDMAAALCMAKEAGCVAEHLTGEPLDLNRILREGKTHAPFVVAPPNLAKFLQERVHPRISPTERE